MGYFKAKELPLTNQRKLFLFSGLHQRRARDSNPQLLSEHLISSQAANHSLTLRAAPIKSEKERTDKGKRIRQRFGKPDTVGKHRTLVQPS